MSVRCSYEAALRKGVTTALRCSYEAVLRKGVTTALCCPQRAVRIRQFSRYGVGHGYLVADTLPLSQRHIGPRNWQLDSVTVTTYMYLRPILTVLRGDVTEELDRGRLDLWYHGAAPS